MLSEREKDALFQISGKLLRVRTRTQLRRSFDGPLQTLLRYDSFLCGFGRVLPVGIRPSMLVSGNFPLGYLDAIRSEGSLRLQTVDIWLRARSPLALNLDEGCAGAVSLTMLEAARRYRFRYLLCHGQMDLDHQHLSYVVFNRGSERIGERDCKIIEYLMPQLHAALARASESCDSRAEERASPACAARVGDSALDISLRRKQVLYLLSIGKTNAEIAQILQTSINNVKYHIKCLNAALGTRSRGALTATASRYGILPGFWPD